MIGQTLGHYRIDSKLGAGGMGVVYRAFDTHLDRWAAIKVLRPDANIRPEQKRRFVQEAKAASALNHPNIVHVYDISIATLPDGPIDFIAMEFVSGQTLDRCIGKSGLNLTETLKYGIQVADALARAHGAGIIHRDLKPGNIMVADDGRIKLLDFGLAKLAETVEGNLEGATATMHPNDSPQTQEGVIVGTVAYMSPEQAEGKKLDARSDIFSFGSVLYEAVTGRQAFRGDTKISTLSAILHKDPQPVREIAANVPSELERIIRRCLRKDPERRMQYMADVRVALEDLREELDSTGLEEKPPARAPKTRRWLAVMGSILLFAASVALGFWLLPPDGPDLSSYRLTPFATEAGEENSPAWSPDGKTLAYVAETGSIKQVYTRSLDAPAATRITSSVVDCNLPFFSPDGSRIYYTSRGDLWSVGAAGGTPQVAMKNVAAASISPDGKALAFSRGGIGAYNLWIASPPGAEPKEYRQPPLPQQVTSLSPPLFSPDGSKIGFFVSRQAGASQPEFWIAPYPTGPPARVPLQTPEVFQVASHFGWMPDSRHIVFPGDILRRSHLRMADTKSGRMRLLTATENQELQPAVSPDGRRIAFASGSIDYDMVEIGIDGKEMRQMLATSRKEWMPTWSPAGTQYGYITDANLDTEIWMRSSEEGSARPVVKRDPQFPWYDLQRPRFSPDGRRISYDVYGPKHVIAISSVGGGSPVVLDQESTDQHGSSWSPDGNWLAYRRLNGSKWELVKTPIGGGKPVFLDVASQAGGDTDWSPNGEWICHPRDGGLVLVSADGKIHNMIKTGASAFGFSRDSATLYAIRRGLERRWELAAFAVPAGEAKKVVPLDLPLSVAISGFSMHPTGKSFATSVGVSRFDIWLLEGFPQPRPWF